MRIPRDCALALLLLSGSAWGQTQVAAGTGHFENWLDEPPWGADKQSFEAATAQSIRSRIVVFAVAENGFGQRTAFTDSKWTFDTWGNVSAWCTAPGTLLVRLGEDRDPTVFQDFDAEDLSTIVDAYFGKYASEFEVSGPECTRSGLRLPDPNAPDRARVIEILEAASAENRQSFR